MLENVIALLISNKPISFCNKLCIHNISNVLTRSIKEGEGGEGRGLFSVSGAMKK